MINYNYLITLSIVSSVVQTLLYALLLTFAYTYWAVPNAGLIIGTIAPLLIVLLFIMAIIQNVVMLSARNNDVYVVFILLGILLVIPFVINFTWLSPILVFFNALILYLPFLLRKYFGDRIRK